MQNEWCGCVGRYSLVLTAIGIVEFVVINFLAQGKDDKVRHFHFYRSLFGQLGCATCANAPKSRPSKEHTTSFSEDGVRLSDNRLEVHTNALANQSASAKGDTNSTFAPSNTNPGSSNGVTNDEVNQDNWNWPNGSGSGSGTGVSIGSGSGTGVPVNNTTEEIEASYFGDMTWCQFAGKCETASRWIYMLLLIIFIGGYVLPEAL